MKARHKQKDLLHQCEMETVLAGRNSNTIRCLYLSYCKKQLIKTVWEVDVSFGSWFAVFYPFVIWIYVSGTVVRQIIMAVGPGNGKHCSLHCIREADEMEILQDTSSTFSSLLLPKPYLLPTSFHWLPTINLSGDKYINKFRAFTIQSSLGDPAIFSLYPVHLTMGIILYLDNSGQEEPR